MHAAQTDLARVAASLVSSQPLTPGKVAFAWRMAVGPALARATRTVLSGNTLTVIASGPHWQREVERAEPGIRRQLAVWLGPTAVRRLVVFQSPAHDGS
jgi:hypothetical protein